MRKSVGRSLLLVAVVFLMAWGIDVVFPFLPSNISVLLKRIWLLLLAVAGALAILQQITGFFPQEKSAGLVLAIQQDSRRTFFYVPDETANRYNQPHRNMSYSIHRFEFDVTCYSKVTLKSVDGFIFHPLHNCRFWGEVHGCEIGQIVTLPQTSKVISVFNQNNPKYETTTIDPDHSATISVPKCGWFSWSLEHGENGKLFAILVFHVNTSFLWVLCNIPEMSSSFPATILDYRLSDRNTRDEVISWAGEDARRAYKAKETVKFRISKAIQ